MMRERIIGGRWAVRVWVAFVAALAATPGAARAGSVYFLISELPGQQEHHDSFVLPIEETNLAALAHARDLVRRGPAAGQTLFGADIVAGTDNINRDLLAPS